MIDEKTIHVPVESLTQSIEVLAYVNAYGERFSDEAIERLKQQLAEKYPAGLTYRSSEEWQPGSFSLTLESLPDTRVNHENGMNDE